MDSSKIDIGLAERLRIDGLVMDWQIGIGLARDWQIGMGFVDRWWIGRLVKDRH